MRRDSRLSWNWGRTPLELPAPLQGAAGGPPCVVHLVRALNGVDSLREFATALRAHPPGIEHELVLALKGFASAREARPYLEAVEDLEPTTLFFADRGFDLGVFFLTAARLRRERYCFLNSNGRPLVAGWLAKLNAALDLPGVGQVGPFGSWASLHSWTLYATGLPSAYRALLPPRRVVRGQLAAVQVQEGSIARASVAHSIRMRLSTLPNVPHELFGFAPFPNPHLRSSVFMVTHAALTELCVFAVRTKLDTFEIESGRESLTRQLQRLGLATLVVDRAGAVYGPEQWPRSRTFLQGDQEGLLIADNHTLRYTVADFDHRSFLSACAWGSHADPTPPWESPPARGGGGADLTLRSEGPPARGGGGADLTLRSEGPPARGGGGADLTLRSEGPPARGGAGADLTPRSEGPPARRTG
jgi:hypothetical protein